MMWFVNFNFGIQNYSLPRWDKNRSLKLVLSLLQIYCTKNRSLKLFLVIIRQNFLNKNKGLKSFLVVIRKKYYSQKLVLKKINGEFILQNKTYKYHHHYYLHQKCLYLLWSLYRNLSTFYFSLTCVWYIFSFTRLDSWYLLYFVEYFPQYSNFLYPQLYQIQIHCF